MENPVKVAFEIAQHLVLEYGFELEAKKTFSGVVIRLKSGDSCCVDFDSVLDASAHFVTMFVGGAAHHFKSDDENYVGIADSRIDAHERELQGDAYYRESMRRGEMGIY